MAIAHSAARRGLRFVVELPRRLPVEADETQLEHLLGNLLGNAATHASEGATVTVRAGVVGGAVEVAVHNTGSAISAADLPHVFDCFYRADKSRTRAGAGGAGGNGIGLAIAREVAVRHGGGIRAESALGAGTSFIVTLPAADSRAAGKAHGPHRSPPNAPWTRWRQPVPVSRAAVRADA